MAELSRQPKRKVSAGALGGATAALIFGLAEWAGAPTPPGGVEAALATLVTFLVSYTVEER